MYLLNRLKVSSQEPSPYVYLEKDWVQFRNDMGTRESSNNYKARNRFGYLGCYQFGKARLCDLGYTERKLGHKGYSNDSFKWKNYIQGQILYTDEDFLDDAAFQNQVFREHVINHATRLIKNYQWVLGKEWNDRFVSLSGAVAVCHLVGYGGWINWIKGKLPLDGNGVSAEDYLELFKNYDLTDIL